MKNRTSQLLFAYWDELRAGRTAPKRLDIDPSRISGILPETMMLEATAPGSYRFRIAGTKLCEKLGMELRGLNFIALWGPADQRRIENNLRAMTQHGHMTVFPVRSQVSTGASVYSEIILLPLAAPDGQINRFMGAWSFAQMPVWNSTAYLSQHAVEDPNRLKTSTEADLFGQQPREEPPSLRQTPSCSRIVTSQRRRFRVYDGGRADP